MHGYGSATQVHQIAEETTKEEIRVLYVGDWDPSGLHMSEVDLPRQLDEYGADVDLVRVALIKDDQIRACLNLRLKKNAATLGTSGLSVNMGSGVSNSMR